MKIKSRLGFPRNRSGSIAVLTVVVLVPLLILAAISINVTYINLTKTKLQNAADAAALAAVDKLSQGNGDAQDIKQRAREIGYRNMPQADHGTVINTQNVELGTWDTESDTFTPNTADPNAVRVTACRTDAKGNGLPLHIAGLLSNDSSDVMASSIAALVPATPPGGESPEGGDPGTGTAQFRFLLDDEMFDSDESAIEALASSMGVSSEWPITDNDDDGYIDIPAGTELELPTGQVGDEGMFDIQAWNAFPFQELSWRTELDFLAEGTALESTLGTSNLQDVEWPSSEAPHPDLAGSKLLDPVPGIDPFDSHSAIMNLPDPDTIYVSPVFKSDVSMAETDPSKYGSPAANLQGERRGLVAYKITSARWNPAGGSYLPLLTIEVVAPVDIETMETSGSSSPLLEALIVD